MSPRLATLLRLGPPIVVGVLLRVLLVLAFPESALFGDELHFYQSASDVVAGNEVSHFPFRPPLYIGFVAAVLGLLGPSADGVRFVQCGLEGLAIAGLFLLVRRTLGVKTATVAAWLWALFPDFITFSTTLWSESLSLLLLVWGLLALVLLGERPSARRAVVVGLLWGALALVKPYHLYLLPVLLGWMVLVAQRPRRGDRPLGDSLWADRPRGPMLKAGGLALAVGVLAIVPWSVYQSVKHDRAILICTTGPKNLQSGVNYAPPAQFDFASRWNPRDAERREGPQREVGVVAFIAEHPRLFLKRAWQKMSYLWSPNSYFVRHIYTDVGDGKTYKYGDPARMSPGLRQAAVWLTILTNLLVMVAGLAGLFLAWEWRLAGLAAVYSLTYMAMITLTPSLSRYRLPIMAFLLCFSAAFFVGGVDLRRTRPGLLVGLGATLLVFGAWWSLRVPDLVSAIW